MHRDRVQQLGAYVRLERRRPGLDEPQTEVHVTKQPALLRLSEGRACGELRRAADVVQQRGRQQQVAAQPLVQLRGLAADRGDADGVLEQAAGVRVVRLGGRQPAQAGPDRLVVEEAQYGRAQAWVR